MNIQDIMRGLSGGTVTSYAPSKNPQPVYIGGKPIKVPDEDLEKYISDASTEIGVPKSYIRAIIERENAGHIANVSWKGVPGVNSTATGLGQFLDSTAEEVGLKDSTDPAESVKATARYLKKHLDSNNGDFGKAAMRYIGGTDALGTSPEEYAGDVLSNQRKFSQIYGETDMTGNPGTSSETSSASVNMGIGSGPDIREQVRGILGSGQRPAAKPSMSIQDVMNGLMGITPVDTTQLPPVETPAEPVQEPVKPTEKPFTPQFSTPPAESTSAGIGQPQKPVETQIGQAPEKKLATPFVGDVVNMVKNIGGSVLRTVQLPFRAKEEQIKTAQKISTELREELKGKEEISFTDPIYKKIIKVVHPEIIFNFENNGKFKTKDLIDVLDKFDIVWNSKEEKKLEEINSKIVSTIDSALESKVLKEDEVKRLGGAAGVAQDITGVVTQVLAQVGVSLAYPPAGVAMMASQIGGNTLKVLDENGISVAEAAPLALLNTAAQTGLEKYSIGKIINISKKASVPLLRKLAQGMLTEGATEAPQQIPDDILGQMWADTKGKTLGEKIKYYKDNWKTLAKNAGYAGFLGAFGGGAGVGLATGIENLSKAQKEVPPVEKPQGIGQAAPVEAPTPVETPVLEPAPTIEKVQNDLIGELGTNEAKDIKLVEKPSEEVKKEITSDIITKETKNEPEAKKAEIPNAGQGTSVEGPTEQGPESSKGSVEASGRVGPISKKEQEKIQKKIDAISNQTGPRDTELGTKFYDEHSDLMNEEHPGYKKFQEAINGYKAYHAIKSDIKYDNVRKQFAPEEFNKQLDILKGVKQGKLDDKIYSILNDIAEKRNEVEGTDLKHDDIRNEIENTPMGVNPKTGYHDVSKSALKKYAQELAIVDENKPIESYIKKGIVDKTNQETHNKVIDVLSQVPRKVIVKASGMSLKETYKGIQDIRNDKPGGKEAKVIRELIAPSIYYGETVEEAVKSLKGEGPKFSRKKISQLDIFGGEKPISQIEKEETQRLQKIDIKKKQEEINDGQADLTNLPMFENAEMDGSQMTLQFSRKMEETAVEQEKRYSPPSFKDMVKLGNKPSTANAQYKKFDEMRSIWAEEQPLPAVFKQSNAGGWSVVTPNMGPTSKDQPFRVTYFNKDEKGMYPTGHYEFKTKKEAMVDALRNVGNDAGAYDAEGVIRFSKKDRTPEQEAQIKRLRDEQEDILRRADLTDIDRAIENNNKLVDFLSTNDYTYSEEEKRYVKNTTETAKDHWSTWERNARAGTPADYRTEEIGTAFRQSQEVKRGEEVKNVQSKEQSLPQGSGTSQGNRSDNKSKAAVRLASVGDQRKIEQLIRKLSDIDRNDLNGVDYSNDDVYYVEPTPIQQAIVQIVEAITKRPAFFVHHSERVISSFNGVNYSNRIYLDDSSQNPFLETAFHETHEQLKKDNPKNYEKFLDIVFDNLTEEGLKKVESRAKFERITPREAAKEFGFDWAAEVMTEKSFWDELQIKANDVFNKFVDNLLKIMEKFLRLIPKTSKYDKMFKDTQTMRDELKNVIRNSQDGNTKESADGMIKFMMKAFHGSPYKFDKFEMRPLTGEGTMVFGHGLYFTSSEQIASHYAKALGYENKVTDIAVKQAIRDLKEEGKERSIENLKEVVGSQDYVYSYGRGKINKSLKLLDEVEKKGGIKNLETNLYEVTLHEGKEPDEYDYLQWDKPVIDGQLNKIIKYFKKEGLNRETLEESIGDERNYGETNSPGEKIYKAIADDLGSEKNASEWLLKAGIDGIEYPAGSMSAMESGERNYVVFDPEAVTIKERVSFSKKEKNPDQLDLFAQEPEVKPETTALEDTKTGEQKPIVAAEQVSLFETPKEAKEIQDFGEKIGGARKDVYSEYQDRFETAKEVDIAVEPLSKSWPEPDYQKMIEAGTDPWTVGWIRSMRDEIPTKPQRSWRLSRWVDQVKVLRGLAGKLISGETTKEKLTSQLDKPEFRSLKEYVGGRAELYELIGHGVSLKGVTLRQHHYSVYHGEKNVSKWQVERGARSTAMSNMPSELGAGNTRQEAIDDFKSKLSLLTPTEQKGRKIEFVVYTRRDTKKAYVAKKMGSQRYLELQEFDTAKEALDYRKNNQAELEAQLERLKEIPSERREFNRERIGQDHRKGKEVTPEMFNNDFGFRGVEFGNWVNNKERQDNLNRAFDSLHDLASILKIPSRAISLNGELGLAFGARGHGGKNPAAAHYEPGKVVINLTKKNGPGSLAHEWWHALDSYISRQRGKKLDYITDRPMRLSETDTTRPELLEAFKGVVEAIKKTGLKKRSEELDTTRSEEYWGTGIEMSARSFENYVIEKLKDMGATNDYLSNIASSSEYMAAMGDRLVKGRALTQDDIYPYLLPEEIKTVKPEFDNLFETIKTEETDKGTMMFSRKQPADTFFSPTLRAVEGLKQERGTGDQMFAMITKTPGVKETEWKWMGLDDFLKGKQSVTKAEIEDFVRQNQVEIEEVEKRNETRGYKKNEINYMGISDENGVKFHVITVPDNVLKLPVTKYKTEQDVIDRVLEKTTGYDKAKFSKYTLPGGESYREVLLTLPPKKGDFNALRRKFIDSKTIEEAQQYEKETIDSEPTFKSSHWSEPNVIAHIRMDDRTGPNGEKVLFVEEIQSDWARGAREYGTGKRFTVREAYDLFWVDDTRYPDRKSPSFATRNDAQIQADGMNKITVPNQPFLKNWEELTLKRILRLGAEGGYDKVSWINGEQTANRYDLSKQVSEIAYWKQEDGKYGISALDKDGKTIDGMNPMEDLTPQRLESIIGKEPARKIIMNEGDSNPEESGYLRKNGKLDDGVSVLQGELLEIGGEWAINLYNRMVPKFYEKYGKKWGAKVENIEIPISGKTYEITDINGRVHGFESESARDRWVEKNNDMVSEEQPEEPKTSFMKQQSIAITPEMRESVLEEGQPMFSRKQEEGPAPETEVPIEQRLIDIYEQATKDNGKMVKKLSGDNKVYREYKDRIVADIFVPLSTRLKNIGEDFKQAIRKFEYKIGMQETADNRAIQPLLKDIKKMKLKDRVVFDLALKNEDWQKVEDLIIKYDLEKEYDDVRDILDGIYKRAVDAGFDIGYAKNYWPRSVLNPSGLIKELSDLPEWGIIEEQIRIEEKKLGRSLSEIEMAKIANQFIARPDRIVRAPGNIKERTIDLIDETLDKYYDDSLSALVKYTHEMNQAIETKKFFKFEKEDIDGVALDLFIGEPKESTRIIDIDGGIGRYVLKAIKDGKMKPEQQEELVGLLKARFNYRPSGSIVQKVKELGYITSMGSGFSSFITQIGDLAWAYYVSGPIKATAAFGKALVGKSNITKTDIGLERIAEEFRTGRGFGKTLQRIFDWTLLTKMDNIGKETLINSSLKLFRVKAKQGNKEFVSRVNEIFGEEADQVIEDLKNKVDSENVKYLLFNKLLDFQPMSLSEMPLKYLTSPNGRIFYMLKTFTIKQLDVFRNESVSKIAEGIKRKDNRIILEGIRNLVYLAGLFIMANAGADELKDWLFGRKPSFSDKVWDNILRLFGLSRFIVWETRRAGPVKAFWKLITPPMDVIEAPLKDVQNFLKDDEIGTDLKIKNAETWKMIPFIGKHYYWWFGGGKESENKKQEKDNPYAKYIRGVRQRKAKYTKIAKAGYKRELDARKKGNAKKAEKIKKETAEKKARIIKERDSFVKKNKKEAFDYKKTLNENID